LNDLVGQWRKRPTPAGAVAACDALALQAETGGARQPQLARTLAEETTRTYPNDLDVLLSVGRMLLAHSQLQMAKRHLLGAAKLAAEPRAPRLLGEVLLRQGDAKRAVRALQRAIQLGAADDETRGWYESANAYVTVQEEQGIDAVARAVDEGFRTQDGPGHAGGDLDEPESEDDDAPTVVATAPQGAVLQLLERASAATNKSRPERPERPAVPRDDEATGLSTLVPERDESPTRISRDEAPTRITATSPPGGTPAIAPAPPAIAPAPAVAAHVAAVTGHAVTGHAVTGHAVTGHAVTGHAVTGHAVTGPKPHGGGRRGFGEEQTAIMTDVELERLRSREQAEKRGPALRSTTTKITKEEEEAAEDVIAARAKEAAAKQPPPPEPPPPPDPAPNKAASARPAAGKRGIVEEDSDDAWHLAVAKKGDAPPSSKISKSRARRRSGMLAVGVATTAIFVTLGVGVRTGRLPEVAGMLPPWMSGQEEVAKADPAIAAAPQERPAPQPAAQPDQPAPAPAPVEPAKPAEPAPQGNGDGEKVAENPEPATEEPAPQPARHTYPVPTPRRTRPQPEQPAPAPQPATAPAPPKPKPGKGPDEPVWLGDPELK
jgi:hypothetical protein